MRFSAAVAAAGLAAGASAYSNGTVYTTEVVTAYTTYCPEATTLTHGESTYTVSEATTLTITNCPGGCTISKPVYTSPAVPTTYPVTTLSTTTPAPYYPTANATVPVYPSGTGATTGPIVSFTGAAANAGAAAGAGLLAIFGLVAAL